MNVCKEIFLIRFFFDMIACLAHSQHFTIPHFNDKEAFFSYEASSYILELSLHTTTLIFLQCDWRSNLLTRAKLVQATHCIEHNVAMRTKTTNTQAVNFLLSAWYLEALSFATWSLFVEQKTWPYFRSYGSCFVEVRFYLSLDWDPNAYMDRWVWVDMSNMGLLG